MTSCRLLHLSWAGTCLGSLSPPVEEELQKADGSPGPDLLGLGAEQMEKRVGAPLAAAADHTHRGKPLGLQVRKDRSAGFQGELRVLVSGLVQG